MKQASLRIVEYHHSATAKYVIEGLRVNGKRKRLFFKTKAEASQERARRSKRHLEELRRTCGAGG